MSRYLDPKADVVFKRIFGEHPHLLKSFLNAVLPLTADSQIAELSYLPSEQVPHIPTLKRTIADVKCIDVQGRTFIVEMQIEWTDSFKQRLLFEAGQAFVKQLKPGEEYHLLRPVYGLGIVAATFDPSPEWYHHYQIVNVGKPVREIIEHLQLVFIELPKFPVQSSTEKQLRLLWLRFLREINEQTKTVSQELLAVPEISQAVELAEQAAYNSAELDAYESHWDQVSREKTLMAGRYEEGKLEGRMEGVALGREEGVIQGRIEGVAQGREEGVAQGRMEGVAQGRLEGVAKGIVEGRAKGQIEGETAMLLRLVKHKFPTLSATNLAKIETLVEHATAEQLLAWGESILDAQVIQDVFDI